MDNLAKRQRGIDFPPDVRRISRLALAVATYGSGTDEAAMAARKAWENDAEWFAYLKQRTDALYRERKG